MSNFTPKVIVIGEKAIDKFVYVNVTRSNPEAPSLIGVPIGMEIKGGMAENVYNNLLSLGLKKEEVCFISNPTAIIKERFVDKNSNYIVFRLDHNDDSIEKNHEYFDGDTYKKLKSILENHKTVKLIAISDYCKNFLDSYWIEQIVILAHKFGVKVIMDSKKILGDFSKDVDFVKINWREYQDNLKTNKSPEGYCRNLFATKGGDGVFWVNKGLDFPAEKVGVVDSVGAGDSFCSGFIVKYLQNENIEESIRWANKVASVAVRSKGTYCVKLQEVEELG